MSPYSTPSRSFVSVRPSVLFLRGGLALLFAVLVFVWPVSALMALTLLVGAYLFADGAFALFNHRSGWSIFQGLVGIGVGLITFFRPGVTAAALALLVGIWALLTGGAEVAAAFGVSRIPGMNKGVSAALALVGFISIAFGFLVLFAPIAGAIALVTLIGVYALCLGIANIVAGFQARKLSVLDEGEIERHHRAA